MSIGEVHTLWDSLAGLFILVIIQTCCIIDRLWDQKYRKCMGGIAPLALSWTQSWYEILTECWILPRALGRRILIWGVGLGIISECGLSQLIYNQGCLLFWNLWCFVRFVFHKYFPKIRILSSRNRFIQEQSEWIISRLPSLSICQSFDFMTNSSNTFEIMAIFEQLL